MKKKLLSVLCAGVLCCTALCAPVSAAEEPAYQLGDVNMDGNVNSIDAKILLNEYVRYLAYLPGELTEEQIALGDVDGLADEQGHRITMLDAYCLLGYYSASYLAKIDVGTVTDFTKLLLDPNSEWYSVPLYENDYNRMFGESEG